MYQKMGISRRRTSSHKRLEACIVDAIDVAPQREQLHAEVKPFAAILSDGLLEPLQLGGPASLRLADLRQPDEAARIAAHGLGVVLVDVGAVNVVALQHADVDARDLHLGDHALGRGFQVFQVGRVELHEVVDAVDGDFGLAVAAKTEVDVGHFVDVVGGKVEQRLLYAGAVALAPVVGEVAQMILPKFARERGAGIAGTGRKAAEDMVVCVDDEGLLFVLGLDGAPASAEELNLSFGHCCCSNQVWKSLRRQVYLGR